MSELVSCKACNHQVAKTAKTCPSCGVADPAKHPLPPPTFKDQIIGVIILGVIGFSLYSCVSDSPAEKAAKETAKAEKAAADKKAGFHCLSGWDGSHREVVSAVKSQLRDPSSFEHVQTRVSPMSESGEHRLVMTYRAKNGFGALTGGQAVATYRNATCTAQIVSID